MDDIRRDGPRTPVARRALTLTMAACLLVSCSSEETRDRATEPDDAATATTTSPAQSAELTRSPGPRPTPVEDLRGLPTVPARRDAAALARQLGRVTATLRER